MRGCRLSGDVGVILGNHGTEPFTVNDGERIAQMIISKYEQAEWEPVSSIEDLEITERGEQGFGHSGINKSNRYILCAHCFNL